MTGEDRTRPVNTHETMMPGMLAWSDARIGLRRLERGKGYEGREASIGKVKNLFRVTLDAIIFIETTAEHGNFPDSGEEYTEASRVLRVHSKVFGNEAKVADLSQLLNAISAPEELTENQLHNLSSFVVRLEADFANEHASNGCVVSSGA